MDETMKNAARASVCLWCGKFVLQGTDIESINYAVASMKAHDLTCDESPLVALNKAQAAEIARLKARVAELEGEVEFWKSASEAQRRKNCDECVRIAEGKMVAKLQARVAELEAMLHDIIDSIPSTYDEEDPTVKRHAAALNVAWNSLKEVGHDG